MTIKFRGQLFDAGRLIKCPETAAVVCMSSFLFSQAQLVPAFAAVKQNPVFPVVAGGVDAEAAIKSIGKLHLSEGKIVIRQNQIFVFSDTADNFADAELAGSVILNGTTTDAKGPTVHGTAIFTRGYSISALDDPKLQDVVRGNDGEDRLGRIVDVTPTMLRIKTKSGVRALPVKYIVDVKSPRAFTFALPLTASPPANPSLSNTGATATGDKLLSPSITATAAPTASVPAKTVITFSQTNAPTAVADAASQQTQVQYLSAQLTKKHPAKSAMKVAAIAGGIAAAFAIPMAIALTCPRPGSTNATGGGNNAGN